MHAEDLVIAVFNHRVCLFLEFSIFTYFVINCIFSASKNTGIEDVFNDRLTGVSFFWGFRHLCWTNRILKSQFLCHWFQFSSEELPFLWKKIEESGKLSNRSSNIYYKIQFSPQVFAAHLSFLCDMYVHLFPNTKILNSLLVKVVLNSMTALSYDDWQHFEKLVYVSLSNGENVQFVFRENYIYPLWVSIDDEVGGKEP